MPLKTPPGIAAPKSISQKAGNVLVGSIAIALLISAAVLSFMLIS